MLSALITTLLLAGQLSLSVCQGVGGDPSAPPVPQSLDNFGADVSDFSIMYTKNLEEIMRRFKISRSEMQEMLQQYVRGGVPAITKTVYNPETKLNETITLDFKSFTEGGPDIRPPGTASGPVETVRVVNNQRPDVIEATAGFRQNPTEVVPLAGDPGVTAPGWRQPPSPVMDGNNPQSGTDLTAMREYEGNLIDDLKLLQRRRDALDESFSKGEINEEDYRTNVQNNEQQMRDAYMVLQQIQDGIREFLGIPVQRPSAVNSIEPTLDDTMTGNILTGTQALPMPGMTPNGELPVAGGTLTPEDERLLQSILQNQPGLQAPGLQGIESTGQQLAGTGRPMTPEEEIKFLESEINLIRNANAEMLSSLRDLRMPSDGVPTAELPSTFENNLQRLQRGGTLLPDVGRDLPSPSPAPAVSDSTPLSDPNLAWNGPSTEDSVAGDVGSDLLRPSPAPGVSGFSSAPRQVNPVVRDNQMDGRNEMVFSDLTTGLSPDSNTQNRINNLIDQYNMLHQREKDIIGILNNADPVQGPEGNSRDSLIDDVLLRQNNPIDSGMPRRNQERLAGVDPNGLDPVTIGAPLSTDPRSDPRTQPDALVINNLLDEYSKLNQRENEIVGLLNMQDGLTNIGRNEGMDISPPLPRREFDRTISQPNPPVNTDSTMDERGPMVTSQDFLSSDNINRGALENDILRRSQNIEEASIFRNNLGPSQREFDRSIPIDVNQDIFLNDPNIIPNYSTSDNVDRTIRNRDPLRRRLQEVQTSNILRNNFGPRPDELALNVVDRPSLLQQRSNIDNITPASVNRRLNRQIVMSTDASPRSEVDRSVAVANNFLRDVSPLSGDIGLNVDDRTRFPQPRPNIGITAADNILRDNVGPLAGNIAMSAADRPRFHQQRPNIDNYLLSNQEFRPTVGPSAVVPTTGEDSRSTRTDTSDRNLIYNDGTITMESVRYDLPSDAVEEPIPVGSDTALTSDFPVSGFSSRASGLLTPRTDAFSLPNRRGNFFGQRRLNSMRNHIRLPFYRRQSIQGLERREPARRVVSLF